MDNLGISLKWPARDYDRFWPGSQVDPSNIFFYFIQKFSQIFSRDRVCLWKRQTKKEKKFSKKIPINEKKRIFGVDFLAEICSSRTRAIPNLSPGYPQVIHTRRRFCFQVIHRLSTPAIDFISRLFLTTPDFFTKFKKCTRLTLKNDFLDKKTTAQNKKT